MNAHKHTGISRLFSVGSILDGAVAKSPEFIANKEHMNLLNEKLRSLTAKIYECGGEKALQKQRERGKLPVRERINTLLDQGSPFLEIGLLGGYEMYKEMWIPSGGIITGIGSVNG